ncbi:MAG: homoserine kinase [Rickettsiales bacterium]|nr:homoserine kinase [Rickettsiales bacterium]
MAVFTKLLEADFSQILSEYNIGSLISFSGISEGIENTNYILETDIQKFIFTIYEKRVSEEDLPFFINLMLELNKNNYPCPLPIAKNDNSYIGKFNGKNYLIVSMLKGKWPRNIGNNEVYKAGKFLAKLHINSEKLPKNIARKNSMAYDFWRDLFNKISSETEKNFAPSFDKINNAFNIIQNNWPKNLPSGIIHADYFPDNVLFENDEVSGVIDFYMSCNDFYAYDLAITLNAWCFERDFSFNYTKAKELFEGYNSIRKLSSEEISAMPILAIGASLRFLSTRLYDYFNRVEGAVVNVKNPVEYIEKLKFHMQINSPKEYGL